MCVWAPSSLPIQQKASQEKKKDVPKHGGKGPEPSRQLRTAKTGLPRTEVVAGTAGRGSPGSSRGAVSTVSQVPVLQEGGLTQRHSEYWLGHWEPLDRSACAHLGPLPTCPRPTRLDQAQQQSGRCPTVWLEVEGCELASGTPGAGQPRPPHASQLVSEGPEPPDSLVHTQTGWDSANVLAKWRKGGGR